MSEVILSDYFYGDESEQFIYFRIPRLLITSPRFKHLSTDAKLLYGMLLDRMSLSAKNNWYDEDGRVYIYYTVEEICGDMLLIGPADAEYSRLMCITILLEKLTCRRSTSKQTLDTMMSVTTVLTAIYIYECFPS